MSPRGCRAMGVLYAVAVGMLCQNVGLSFWPALGLGTAIVSVVNVVAILIEERP